MHVCVLECIAYRTASHQRLPKICFRSKKIKNLRRKLLLLDKNAIFANGIV